MAEKAAKLFIAACVATPLLWGARMFAGAYIVGTCDLVDIK